jgi:hypothetical protein
VNPKTIEHVRSSVNQTRLTRTATFFLAACGLVFTIGCALYLRPATLPSVIACAALVLIAGIAQIKYADTVERLAIEPEGAEVPDLNAYLKKITDHKRRKAMASWIREALREAGQPGSLYLAERVRAHQHQLRILARDLDSEVAIQPRSVATCARLLTAAAESPLYNPRIPTEQLMSILLRIRLGIDSGGSIANEADVVKG